MMQKKDVAEKPEDEAVEEKAVVTEPKWWTFSLTKKEVAWGLVACSALMCQFAMNLLLDEL